MTEEFKNFKFPSYEDIVKANRLFIDRKEYRGYAINIPVNDTGLYMLIECQNDNVLSMGDNCIRFAWCNKAGFAIASERYINNEAGYIMGCAFLITAANDIIKCFDTFINKNMSGIRKRINKYEQTHID